MNHPTNPHTLPTRRNRAGSPNSEKERLPMSRSATRWVLAALAAVCLCTARPSAAQNYTVQTVDAPGKDFFAIPIFNFTMINNTGVITQQYYGPDPPVGFGHTA